MALEKDKLVGLVTKAQQGDNDAMNELFNAFYNDLYYFALKTVKEEDLALDVTQESFVEIINTIGKLEEPAAFVTWAKQITYHQCTRYFKKKKDVIVDEDEDGNTVFDTLKEENSEFIPDEALDKDDFKKTILAILNELSEEQRSAVMMYYFDEMSVKQIAEIQGTTEGTVKSRLNYARKAIKASVEDYEKKNGIKLHAIPFLPLFRWVFKGAFEGGLPSASAELIAEGVATATGASITATAASATAATAAVTTTATAVGIGAKIAAAPLVTKVIAGVAALTIAVGGGYAVVENADKIFDSHSSQTADDDVSNGKNDSNIENDDVINEDNLNEDVIQDDNSGDNITTEKTEYIVPDGCKYITIENKVYGAGQTVNAAPQRGDIFETADYIYQYNKGKHTSVEFEGVAWGNFDFGGWGVEIKDTTKTSYEPFADSINGAPIKSIDYAFMNCSNMTVAPELPDTIESVDWAFGYCKALKTSPKLPNGPTWLVCTFYECTSLTETPYIPDSYTNINNAFNGCTSLTKVTNIPSKVELMSYTFMGCSSLKTIPELPNTVTEMIATFCGCASLQKAPVIPKSVRDMASIFMSCDSLTGTVEINAVLREDNLACNDSCNMCRDNIYENCENCQACCSYADCFGGSTSLPIILKGTCPKLDLIAKACNWNNVTVG